MKIRKIVSGVLKVIFVHISNNSRASMVLFRQWFIWGIRIDLTRFNKIAIQGLPQMAVD